VDQSPYAKERNDWLDSAADNDDAPERPDTDHADTLSEPSVEQILGESGNTAEGSVPRPNHTLSTIGRTLVFKGDLTAEEDLLIQGRVEGKIRHGAANLTIGPFADVRADIVARHVLVQGKIVGNVHASESVIVEPSANVRGDIHAPRIGLREGAKFKGRIDMDVDAGKPAKERQE